LGKNENEKKKPEISQDIKDALKNLGFTEYYVNIYHTLLISKELDARELSDKAGVPYSRIYEVLNEMIKKNIIIKLDGRPSTFMAKNPAEVFVDLKKKYQQDIEENITRCSDYLSEIYSPEENVEDLRFRLIKGNNQTTQHLRNLLKNTLKEIMLQLSDFNDVHTFIEDELKFLKVKGVKVKLLIDSKYLSNEHITGLDWIDIRISDNVTNSLLIIDDEIAVEAKRGKFDISDPKLHEWIMFQSSSHYFITYVREVFLNNFNFAKSIK
jgi:sugar-specific transcriptional regulator TrmB